MKSENKSVLNELIRSAKQAPATMSEDEALAFIRENLDAPLKKSIYHTKKIIIMTSSILAVAIAASLWFIPEKNMTNQSPSPLVWAEIPEEIASDQASSIGSSSANNTILDKLSAGSNPEINQEALAFPVADTPEIDTAGIPLRVTENTFINGDDMNMEFEYGMPEAQDLPPCKEENKALILGAKELKELGLIADGNTLLYQQEKSEEGNIKLIFKELNMVNQSQTVSGDFPRRKVEVLPVAITNCYGILQYPGKEKLDKKKLDGAFALKVESGKGYLLFWFPRNKDVYAKLPEKIAAELRSNKEAYQVAFTYEEPKVITMTGDFSPKDKKQIAWEKEANIIEINPFLDKLGFKVDEKAINFNRDKKKVTISDENFWLDIGLDGSEDYSKTTDTKKLYPLYITRESFVQGQFSEVTALKQVSRQDIHDEFAFDKFRLVAFRLKHPDLGSFLFWYPYSPALKSLLNEKQRTTVENKLSLVNPNLRYASKRPDFKRFEDLFVNEKASTEALNALTPSKEILERMGVKVEADGKIRIIHLGDFGLLTEKYSKKESHEFFFGPDTIKDEKRRKTLRLFNDNLMYVTDDLGENFHLFNQGGFSTPMNELVPVLVRTGEDYTLSDKINQYHRPDIILWYKPAKELLEIMTSEGTNADNTGENVKDKTEEKLGSCSYTELCRNKKSAFLNQVLYPNPSKGNSTFQWESNKESSYVITLYALNGKEVKVFPKAKAQLGKNSFSLDMQELSDGIYMMILKSDQGDELHERIVLSR